MKDTKFTFTKRRLECLPVAPERIYYRDLGGEGLHLSVLPGGAKTFYLVKKFQGRKVRVPLGRFPNTSVEEARASCRALVTKLGQGIDVEEARQTARHEQTFQGLWGFWLANARQRGVKTLGDDESRYHRFLEPWAGRRLSAIRKGDVQSLFSRVTTDSGPCAANRLLTLLKSMFHRAADMGFVGANPAAGIKKNREEKRDRFLHADELQGFFQALFAEPNVTIRDVLLMALLTGARKGNVLSMQWQDIDFTTCLWRIPITKNGKPVVVPLVPAAVAVLRQRQDATDSAWVFSSAHHACGHPTSVSVVWRRIVQAARLVDCRPHDLRRSLASYMAIGGTSLPVIGKMLGHTTPTSTAVYARLSVDPVRAAAESATATMLQAGCAAVGKGGLIIDVVSEEGGDNGKA